MKKLSLGLAVSGVTLAAGLVAILTVKPVYAKPAEIKTIVDSGIMATTTDIQYKNINAAKKFRFELWDKRVGRTSYRLVDAFFKKRTNKKKAYFKITLIDLKPDRDYEIRYRPVYLGDRLGVWSDFSKWHTKKQGVYFTVTFDAPIADGDTAYIVVDDSSTTTATPGSYALTAVDATTYTAVVEGVSLGDELKFVAARNSPYPRSFEQFDPDNPGHLRSVTVTALPTTDAFTVAAWRWYSSNSTSGNISSENWPITARSQFIVSDGLNALYDDSLAGAVSSTMQTIADSGMKYVTIHYASRMITSGDPVETTEKNIPNTPDSTELETIVTAAQTAGLTPILAIDFPIDSDNEDAILADMAKTHENDYFSTYLTRWREDMNDGIDFAIAHNIGIVVLNTDFYDLHFADDNQEAYFSYILQHDILPVVNTDYSGVLTTANYSTDADFTWYAASEIDWIGDSWYPDLTNSTTPAIADMYASALTQLTTTYAAANVTYGKPIYFSELGVMSWDGAAAAGETVKPDSDAVDPDAAMNDNYPVDMQEQADAYEALFRAIADSSYVVGASSVDYSYAVQYDKIANIRAKPAEDVWARWQALFSAAL